MDLLIIAALSIVLGLILTAMGLSFLSQNLKSLEYNSQHWSDRNAKDYYQNPFFRLNSKYWHYRPKGAVVLTKHQWADIEKNIGIKITEAKKHGLKLGRKAFYVEMQDMIKEKRAAITPSSPYLVLGVESTTPMEEIEAKYKAMLQLYNPNNFVDLDKAFIQLAEIRTEQLRKAWKQVNYGVAYNNGEI